jgi:hypothetical protein
MNNYISEAKNFFSQLLGNANRELLEAAMNGNTEEVKSISDIIYKFSQIEKMLEEGAPINNVMQETAQTAQIFTPPQPAITFTPPQPAKPAKQTKSRTKTTRTAKNKETENLNIDNAPEVVPLTADMTNRRPLSVTIFNETHLANSFRAVAETVCRKLYEQNQNEFLALENNPTVNGDRHKYFSRKQEHGMTDPAIIGSGYKSIYIDVAKLAINNMFFLKRVVSVMNVDPNTVYIALDPNFQRKPREKRS